MKSRFLTIFPVLLLTALPASAETLQQAMVAAYTGNPTLQAERAKLRAIDEQVPLAKSGQRPSIDANADAGYSSYQLNGSGGSVAPREVGVTLTQPIYKGGSIDASISSAEKNVLAARASLRDAEQSLFLSVAQAYFDVVRDESVVKLTRKTEEVLRKELQAARDRMKVGEATKTDTSQADSRYAGSIADRIEAEGRLAISKATYERVVGHAPVDLKDETVTIPVPINLDDAITLAHGNNPQVVAAKYTMEAAEHDVDVASGSLLPELDVQASAGHAWDQTFATKGEGDNAQIMARLTIPLYRSGADYAKTRAAKQTASQRRVEVLGAMDSVRENVVRAWQQLATARATITARKKQVDSALIAYDGVKQEADVGTRTILDRLNAEAESLQAQVDLVTAQRDQAVAMFDVKAAIGELVAEKLALAVTPYNPEDHYEAVRNKWIGVGGDAEPAAATPESAAAPVAEPVSAVEEKSEDSWLDNALGMKW